MTLDGIQRLANIYCAAVAAAEHGVASGHLYAIVAMPEGASLDDHQVAIRTLRGAGLVKEAHHLVTWTGPDDLRHELIAAMEG